MNWLSQRVPLPSHDTADVLSAFSECEEGALRPPKELTLQKGGAASTAGIA